MTTNPLLAQFASEPALIEPAMQERFEACLNALAAHADYAKLTEQASSGGGEEFWFASDDWRARYRPYVVKDSILQIPVKGVLMHNFPFAFGSYATGYDYIWRAFERGIGDTGVRGIALVEDSPGGMVAGCFDAVDKMVALKTAGPKKPVRAFAHESAYSAAYAIACAADHIAVSRTGGVGSIGVVTMHMDMSEALKARGLAVTFIHAGKHKVDGNPAEPLPDDVKARIQARIDELYQVFVSTVARGRGMGEPAVRATEALTFTASQAVLNGLADSIGSLDDAVAAFAADIFDENEGEDEMSIENQAAVDAARTEGHTAGLAEGRTAGLAEGATAERTRITTIIGCDAAKKRPLAAQSAAMNTDMTADQAATFLATLPEEAPATASTDGATPFTEGANRGNPDLGGGGTGGDDDAKAKEDGSDVLALVRGAGIVGFTAPASN